MPTTNLSDLPHFQLPPSPVLRVGVTGGIGSGKSYVCRQLEAAGHRVFSCDEVAKRIIRTDPEVRHSLTPLVGPDVYDSDGRLVKPVLAAYLCRGRECSARVDAIVHPRVAAAFLREAEEMAAALPADATAPQLAGGVGADGRHVTVDTLGALARGRVIYMECALLFESHFDRLVDTSVLVHVSAATQLARLMGRDRISEEKAREWLALQLSEDERMAHAALVLDNEA